MTGKLRAIGIAAAALIIVALVVPVATLAQDGGVTATAETGVKLRTGPGETYASLGNVPIGTTVLVLGRSAAGDWLLVQHEGVRGWAAGWLMTVSGDLNSVPVSSEIIGSPVIVTTKSPLKIRSGPGFEYDSLGSVPAITDLFLLGRTADSAWFLIEYEGARGWIAGWLCWVNGDLSRIPVTDEPGSGGQTPDQPEAPPDTPSPTPQPPAPSGDVTAAPQSNLRIRSGPGTGYETLGTAPYGAVIPVLGRNADSSWIFIEYQGIRGWIAAWLCTISGDLNSVPVTDEGGSGGDTPPPSSPPVSGNFELGGQTHSFGHSGEMAYAGMTWVKFQYKWSPGNDPNDLARRIQDAHARGFRALISIPGASNPSYIDFNAYTQFVAGVAALGADGIEVWNEMNLDREWPAGQINPSSYVNNMLAPAYRAIKAANPGTLVIGGAPAPTGYHNDTNVWSDDRYIAGMAAAGAANYMDCMGVHYNAGATSPDATSGHPADDGAGHYSWYFWPTYNLYANTFPGEKLCYTELGYVTGEGYGSLPPNFAWGNGNTVAEQADWLARSATLLRSTGRVKLMIVFNVDFTQWGDDPQAGYAIIRPDGGCPACQTLHDVMN